MAAAHELDAGLTLLIGDFGLGSDAPIALDYRKDICNPSVIRLRHVQDGDNWGKMISTWVEIAPTFDAFVGMIFEKGAATIQQRQNKALRPCAYSFVRASLCFQRWVNSSSSTAARGLAACKNVLV